MARSQSQPSQRDGGEPVVRRQSPRKSVTGGSAPVLSGGYLQRHSSKNDLVKRLRNVVEQLQDPAVEPNSPDFPGLASLANVLVADQFINHRDKDVRLHTVLACMEIFAVYAPEPPFDDEEILKIFAQMIRQLANLSHCTSPASANFDHYTKILEDLAQVKIGVVLVELIRSLDPSGTFSQREMMDSDDENDENDESAIREEAEEMLCELIKTIIHSVTWEHPAEVYSNAVDAVTACVDEFYQNTPIPVLDEILTPIGAGPTVWVTNPAAVEAAAAIAEQKKKNKKSGKKNAPPINIKMPPSQIQQQNRSYHVAAKVLQKCDDRVAQPVANLLNGLLNGDPKVVDQSNIASADAPPVSRGQDGRSSTADVWDIIFELHKVSSQALTTVIGNLAPLLENEDLDKRSRVTKLLGKLFCSSHSDMANNYRIVFSKWLRRTNDREVKLRRMITKQIATFMQSKAHERELCEETTRVLIRVMTEDIDESVRKDAIHAVCDLAHQEKSSGPLIVPDPQDRNADNASRGFGPVVSDKLLRAVANRVESKTKEERRDALTGLAQIYYKHYVCEKLKDVQRGGDDCDLAVIMDALHDTCFFGTPQAASKKKGKSGGRRRAAQRDFDEDEDEDGPESYSYDIDDKYKWIPGLIFKSGCFTDGKDSGMRDRVNQIIDDVILGPYKAVDDSDSSGSRKKILTPTSRAVGFSMVLDSCRHDDGTLDADALRQLQGLLVQKSNLQTALKGYIEARSRVKDFDQGSEEALTADAEAMEKLREVANLSSPITGSSDHDDVLQSLHSARDKHIFRILATISSPNHSPSSRQRAFDDLPKRTKSLGSATAAWAKKLARRCAMGGFINEESVATCIQLAQECFQEGDVECTRVLLTSARAALQIFRPLGANRESFGALVELYGECQSSHVKNKKQIDQAGIPLLLNQCLAFAAPALSLAPSGKKGDGDAEKCEDELQDMLLRMCTRDGNAEQARYAVYTLSELAKKDEDPAAREKAIFEPLLRSLTSPSRLTIDGKGGRAGDSKKIIQILGALDAVAEFAPSTFCTANGRGDKAVKFALESILLGRSSDSDGGDESGSDEENESSDDEDGEDSVSTSKSKKRSSQGRRRSSSTTKRSADGVSGAASRAVIAMKLLATHIRSTTLASRQANKKLRNEDHIKSVLSVLEQVLRDSGLPPSSRDRRECKSPLDRATLRQSAATSILQLCDPALQLEDKYLPNSCWHLLGSVFTDEEQIVREKVIREFSDLIASQGKYSHTINYAPSLRMLSLIVLCADPENNRNGAVASGNAAPVGKASDLAKSRASVSVTTLRASADQFRAQCVAAGREGEERFDNNFKFLLMPECALPFSLHLLSFRSETPGKSDTTNDAAIDGDESDMEDDTDTVVQESAKSKMLRKRLKWLLEPLVQSLGDGANNISFLLRMVDLLGNKWQPIDVMHSTAGQGEDEDAAADKTFDTISSLGISLNDTTTGYRSVADAKRAQEARARLKAVCFEARELLLKFVKKDINLQTYPGGICFPRNLFESAANAKKQSVKAASEKAIEAAASPFSAKDSLASPMSSIKKSSAMKSGVQRHAHFSPELESRHEHRADNDDDDDDMGGGPFDMDDDDDVMSTDAKVKSKATTKSRRKRTSYGSNAKSGGEDLPLSNSPSVPRGAKNSFGGMSPIAQSASPASSTPSLASSRSGGKRKIPQDSSPAQTEASDLPSQSQSTLGSPESKAASETSRSSPRKKRKVKATPVNIKVSRSSTAPSSAKKSASASKRPGRRAKSKAQAKQQKEAVESATKALVDDELDFDDGEDDFDDAAPNKSRGKKRTASGGRKIAVSTGKSKSKGKKSSSATKSKGLGKSILQNKSRRAKA